MEKNNFHHHKMLGLNIIYSIYTGVFLILFLFGFKEYNIASSVFVIIVSLFLIMTCLGLWLLYLLPSLKPAKMILKIKSYLKYFGLVFLSFLFMMFLFTLQDCSNSSLQEPTTKVSFLSRLPILLSFLILFGFMTLYFISYQRLWKLLDTKKYNKGPYLILSIENLLLAFVFTLDMIVYLANVKAGLLYGYTSFFSQNAYMVMQPTFVYFLFVFGRLLTITILVYSSWMLMNKKRSEEER